MKIGLFGFGKAGKAVASVILQNRDHSLQWIYRKTNRLNNRDASEFFGIETSDTGNIYSEKNLSVEELLDTHPVDAIIDFSSPEGIYAYGEAAAKKNIKIISAISHYAEKEVKFLHKLAKRATVFWSPNITLGINYLLYASTFLKKIAPGVDIEIVEEHFKDKKGISGTAIRIADALDLKDEKINTIRAGGIVGKHEVIFGFPFQTVRLIHESISRDAFGNGALFAAEHLVDKKAGFYKFEDILHPYFKI
ncbi:dihydrodipicolinate reductase [Elizabethkingia meningoseptica]|uniref:4-hydroxy-tetrahydrodipicolinate reductase n=1 Tax=Elizabethkingia meningoseptica TaxID=238 RepID=UPI000936B2B8|nr:dihydrodipicolinate reductase C-terminal domain-containing protein [Elizabethkingia meningoseptica]MDE5488822.1 dihydrodipicolinate reductase [Elizabethkingia meningoseptica]MVW93513.1 dihydrodipicolinate reductase [Elizabethkingia meningoseptica]OPC32167.1 dihydrodipicolinate reductase [Elizabethkingia meningoseptica]